MTDAKDGPIVFERDGVSLVLLRRYPDMSLEDATPADLADAGYVPASHVEDVRNHYWRSSQELEAQFAEAKAKAASLEDKCVERGRDLAELTEQLDAALDEERTQARDAARYERERDEARFELAEAKAKLEAIKDSDAPGWDLGFNTASLVQKETITALRLKLEAAERELAEIGEQATVKNIMSPGLRAARKWLSKNSNPSEPEGVSTSGPAEADVVGVAPSLGESGRSSPPGGSTRKDERATPIRDDAPARTSGSASGGAEARATPGGTGGLAKPEEAAVEPDRKPRHDICCFSGCSNLKLPFSSKCYDHQPQRCPLGPEGGAIGERAPPPRCPASSPAINLPPLAKECARCGRLETDGVHYLDGPALQSSAHTFEPSKAAAEPEATVVAGPHSVWLIEQEHNGVSRWAVVYHGADAAKIERWTLSASAATKYDTRDDALDVLPLIVDDYPSREITVTEHVFDSGPGPYEHALPPKTNDWRDRPLTVGMMVDALGVAKRKTVYGLRTLSEELERIAKGGAR